MAKTSQVLKLECGGRKFSVVRYNGDSNNPFWVYRITRTFKGDGCGVVENRNLEVKFADMRSCLYYLAENY